jgi:phenol hydroxylase P0 protein
MSQGTPKVEEFNCDVTRKFVRVLRSDPGGFVHFEFSIGWPDLAVELVLGSVDFEAFCRTHQVEVLTDATPTGKLQIQESES